MTAPVFDEDLDLLALYATHFFRAPDALGLSYWTARLADGLSIQAVARTFAATPEAATIYPAALTTGEFVRLHYNNALNRDPDAPGLSYWTADLDSGNQSRDTFMLAFIHGALAPTGSPADAAFLTNRAEAGDYFARTLGLDNPDWGGKVMALVTADPATVAQSEALADHFAGLAEPLSVVGIAT